MKTQHKSRDAPAFMQWRSYLIAGMFLLLGCVSVFSATSPTSSITVSEYFYDQISGTYLSGLHSVQSSIKSGSTTLFTESKAQQVSFVKGNGAFKIKIDDIPITVFQHPNVFLKLDADGKVATFSFRAMPYSIHSQLAETASSGEASQIAGTFESTVTVNHSLKVGSFFHVTDGHFGDTKGIGILAKPANGQLIVGDTINANELYIKGTPFYDHLSWKKAPIKNAIYTSDFAGIRARRPFYNVHIYDQEINADQFLINGTNLNPNIYWVTRNTPVGSNTYIEPGNIGIGNEFPKAKLDVNGAISVYTSGPLLGGSIRWTAVDDFKEFQMAINTIDSQGNPTTNWQSTTGISGLGLDHRVGYWAERNNRTELDFIPNLYADYSTGRLGYNAPSLNATFHIRDSDQRSSFRISDAKNFPIIDVGPTAHIGIGQSSTQFDLDVSGNVNAYDYLKNGELLRFAFSSSTYWTRNKRNVYYEWGNVGLGRPDPDNLLEIAAANKKPGMPTINPSITFTSALGTERETSYSLGVNAGKSDQFRFEKGILLGQNPAIFVAESDRFGVGLEEPAANIHVSGNAGSVFTGEFNSQASFNIQTSHNRLLWYPPYGRLHMGVSNQLSTYGGSVFRPDTIGRFSMSFGLNQVASGNLSTVLGGSNNVVYGAYATSLGGSNKKIAGDFSLGIGNGISPLHHGSFIWSDTQQTPLTTQIENQFLIRAKGGIGINTNLTYNRKYNNFQYASLTVAKPPLNTHSFQEQRFTNPTRLIGIPGISAEQSKRIYLKLIEAGYLDQKGVITSAFKTGTPMSFPGLFPERTFEPQINQFLATYKAKDLVRFDVAGQGTAASIKDTGQIFLGAPLPDSDFRLTILDGSVMLNSTTINAMMGVKNIDQDHYPMLLIGNEGIATPGMMVDYGLDRSDLAFVVTELGNVGIGLYPSENATFDFLAEQTLQNYVNENQKQLDGLVTYIVDFDPAYVSFDDDVVSQIRSIANDTREIVLNSGRYFKVTYGAGNPQISFFEASNTLIAGNYSDTIFKTPFSAPPISGLLESAGQIVASQFKFADGTPINPENPVIVWHFAKDPLAESVNTTGEGDATPNVYFPSANLEIVNGVKKISVSGFVGLGTTLPTYLLELSNNSSLQSFSGAVVHPVIQFDMDNQDIMALGMKTGQANRLMMKFPTIESSSTAVMSVLSDRIGIFTETPATADLHVDHLVMVSSTVNVAQDFSTIDSSKTLDVSTGKANALQLAINNKIYPWFQIPDPDDPDKKTLYRFTAFDPNAVPPIYSYTGIGLTTPNADLDVSGDITIVVSNPGDRSIFISNLLNINDRVTMNHNQVRIDTGNGAYSRLFFSDLLESGGFGSMFVASEDLKYVSSNIDAPLNISNLVSKGVSTFGQGGPLAFWVPVPLTSHLGLAETNLMYTSQLPLDPAQPDENRGDQLGSSQNISVSHLYSYPGSTAAVSQKVDLARASITTPFFIDTTVRTNGSLLESQSYSSHKISVKLNNSSGLSNELKHRVFGLNIEARSSAFKEGFKKGRRTAISNGGYAVGLRSDVSNVQIQAFADKGLRYPAIFISGNVAINQVSATAELDVAGTLTATNFIISDELSISTLNALNNIFAVNDTNGVGIGTRTPSAELEIIGEINTQVASVDVRLASDTFSSELGRFIVNSDRNIGIGTLEPVNTLDITHSFSTLPTAPLIQKHLSHSVAMGISNDDKHSLTGTHLSISTSKNTTQKSKNILGSSSALPVTAKALDINLTLLNLDSTATLNGLVVDVSGSNTWPALFFGGAVGVGVTNPGASSSLNVQLEVAGTIRAHNLPASAFNSTQERGVFGNLFLKDDLKIKQNALQINRGTIEELSLDHLGVLNIMKGDTANSLDFTVTKSITVNEQLTLSKVITANTGLHTFVSANRGQFPTIRTGIAPSPYEGAHIQGLASLLGDTQVLDRISANVASINQTLIVHNNRLGINNEGAIAVADIISRPVNNQPFNPADNRTWNDVVVEGPSSFPSNQNRDNVGVLFIIGPDKSTATGSGFVAVRKTKDGGAPALNAQGLSGTVRIDKGSELVFITDPVSSDPQERLRILHTGEVGIGRVADAGVRLAVSGDMNVRDSISVWGALHTPKIEGATLTLSSSKIGHSVNAGVSKNAFTSTPLYIRPKDNLISPEGQDLRLFVENTNDSDKKLKYAVRLSPGDATVITANISSANISHYKNAYTYFDANHALARLGNLSWDSANKELIATASLLNEANDNFGIHSSFSATSKNAQGSFSARSIDLTVGTKTAVDSSRVYKGVDIIITGNRTLGNVNNDSSGILSDNEKIYGLQVSLNQNVYDTTVFPNGSTVSGQKYAATFLAGPSDALPLLTTPVGVVGITSSDNVSFIPSASLHIASGKTLESDSSYYLMLVQANSTLQQPLIPGKPRRASLWVNHLGNVGLSGGSRNFKTGGTQPNNDNDFSEKTRILLNQDDTFRISNANNAPLFVGNGAGNFAIQSEPLAGVSLHVNGNISANRFESSDGFKTERLSMMKNGQGFTIDDKGNVGINVANPTAQLDAAYTLASSLNDTFTPHAISLNMETDVSGGSSPSRTAYSLIVTANPGTLLSADELNSGSVTGLRFNGASLTGLDSNYNMYGMYTKVNPIPHDENKGNYYAGVFMGRVGIGVSNPHVDLVVNGTLKATSVTVNGLVEIDAVVATVNALDMLTTDSIAQFNEMIVTNNKVIEIQDTLSVNSLSQNLLKFDLDGTGTQIVMNAAHAQSVSLNQLLLPSHNWTVADKTANKLLARGHAQFEKLTIQSTLKVPTLNISQINTGTHDIEIQSSLDIVGDLQLPILAFTPSSDFHKQDGQDSKLDEFSQLVVSDNIYFHSGGSNSKTSDLSLLMTNTGAKYGLAYNKDGETITGNSSQLFAIGNRLTIASNALTNARRDTLHLISSVNNTFAGSFSLGEVLTLFSGTQFSSPVTINGVSVRLSPSDMGTFPNRFNTQLRYMGLRVSMDARINAIANGDSTGGYYLPNGTYIPNAKYAATILGGSSAMGTVLISNDDLTTSTVSANATMHIRDKRLASEGLLQIDASSVANAFSVTDTPRMGINTNPSTLAALLHITEKPNTPYLKLNGTDGSAVLIVTANGYMGIATENPTEKLDVNGTIRATNFEATSTTFPSITAGSMAIKKGTSPILTVLSNGRVGINTDAPTAQFDVRSSFLRPADLTAPHRVAAVDIVIDDGTNSTLTYSKNLEAVSIHITPNVRADASGIITGLNIDMSELTVDSSAKKMGLFVNVTGNAAENASAKRYPAIFKTGKVGIGLSNPQFDLDVAGTIAATDVTFVNWTTAGATINLTDTIATTVTFNRSTIGGDLIISKHAGIRDNLTIHDTLKINNFKINQKPDPYKVTDTFSTSVWTLPDKLVIGEETIGAIGQNDPKLKMTGHAVIDGIVKTDTLKVDTIESLVGQTEVSIKTGIEPHSDVDYKTLTPLSITANELIVSTRVGIGNVSAHVLGNLPDGMGSSGGNTIDTYLTNLNTITSIDDNVLTAQDSLFVFQLNNYPVAGNELLLPIIKASEKAYVNIFGYSLSQGTASHLYYLNHKNTTSADDDRLVPITGALKGIKNTIPVYRGGDYDGTGSGRDEFNNKLRDTLLMDNYLGFHLNGSGDVTFNISPHDKDGALSAPAAGTDTSSNIVITNNVDFLYHQNAVTHLDIQTLVENIGDNIAKTITGASVGFSGASNTSHLLGLRVDVPVGQMAASFYAGSLVSANVVIDAFDENTDIDIKEIHHTKQPVELYLITRLYTNTPSMNFYTDTAAASPEVKIDFNSMAIGTGAAAFTATLNVKGALTEPILNIKTNANQTAMVVSQNGGIGMGGDAGASGLKISGATTPQLFNVNDQVVFTNTNFLGIGLTDPTAALSVKGGDIKFEKTSGSGGLGLLYDHHEVSNEAPRSNLFLGAQVPTNIPSLNVNGKMMIGPISLTGAANQLSIGLSLSQTLLFAVSDTTTTIKSMGNNPLHFQTDTATAMTISKNAHIGIGTTEPSVPFHVVGNGQPVVKITATNTTFVMDAAGLVGINTLNPTVELDIHGKLKTSNFNLGTLSYKGALGLAVEHNTGGAAAANSYLRTTMNITSPPTAPVIGNEIIGHLKEDVFNSTAAVSGTAASHTLYGAKLEFKTTFSGAFSQNLDIQGLVVSVDSMETYDPSGPDSQNPGTKASAVFIGHPVWVGAGANPSLFAVGTIATPDAQLNVYAMDPKGALISGSEAFPKTLVVGSMDSDDGAIMSFGGALAANDALAPIMSIVAESTANDRFNFGFEYGTARRFLLINNTASVLSGTGKRILDTSKSGRVIIGATTAGDIYVDTGTPSTSQSATEKLYIKGAGPAADIRIGENVAGTATVPGYGNQLLFSGAPEQSDTIWMARYNVGPNSSELRLGLNDTRTTDPDVAFRLYRQDTNGNSVAVGFNAAVYGHIDPEARRQAMIENPAFPEFTYTQRTGVGIGLDNNSHLTPSASLHVKGDVNGSLAAGADSATAVNFIEDDHLVQIENTHSSAGLGLAISLSNPSGTASDYISFFGSTSDSHYNLAGIAQYESKGQFRSDDGNGVIFETSGADYAEYLPKSDPQESFSTGDVVGVHHGQIKKSTVGADQVLVISSSAIVAGNRVANIDDYELVAFLGQVPVKVKGAVTVGDWIVPSEDHDGTAIALGADQLTAEHMHHILGRAIESQANDRGQVKIMIGFSDEMDRIVLDLKVLDDIKKKVIDFKAENQALAQKFSSITDQNDQLIQRLKTASEARK